MALICLSSAWIAGILLGAVFNLPLSFILASLVPLPLLLYRRHQKIIILTSLCFFTLVAGAYRFQTSQPHSDEKRLLFYNDRGTVAVRGMVDSDPEIRDASSQIRLAATDIRLDTDWQEVSGTVLVFAPRYPACSYGDILTVSGELETPPRFDDFDYRDYLTRQGIYSTMRYPDIEIVAHGQGSKLQEWVYSFRNRLSQTLARTLPEPQASLAQGIILGISGNIPEPVKANFSYTGTAHLLAISGLHLSVIAGILVTIGLWCFGRRHYLYVWLALAAIWFYVLITGLHLPVIRGAIMASLFLVAELLGRQRTAVTALFLAAAIMTGVNPQVLWDGSFQMSFLAMVGLIFVFPILQSLGRKAAEARLSQHEKITSIANLITDSLGVSLAATIAVWPLIAYYFGIVSLVGPLATFLTAPTIPGIITIGVLTGSLGVVALPLAQVLAWFVWLCLSYMLLMVNIFAAAPASFLKVGTISGNWIWAYYSVLVLLIWLERRYWRVYSGP
ncbi:MAG: ComEC/Rec2 family competence protein [Dehalococcoidales bacterium]|nr:ComEC/Rec2 family competence protein [Dehalococcoidales bacterium]